MTAPSRRIAWLLPSAGMRGPEQERRRALIASWLPPHAEVDVLSPPRSPAFVDTAADLAQAISASVQFAGRLDPSRYHVAVLAGAVDPGLRAVREAAPIPVVGPFESAMFLATALNRPLGVIAVDANISAAVRDLVAERDHLPDLVALRELGIPVRDIVTGMHDPEAGRHVRAAIVDQVGVAVEAGAEAIYFSTMTLGTLGIEAELVERFGVRVLEPNRIAARTALTLLAVAGLEERPT